MLQIRMMLCKNGPICHYIYLECDESVIPLTKNEAFDLVIGVLGQDHLQEQILLQAILCNFKRKLRKEMKLSRNKKRKLWSSTQL